MVSQDSGHRTSYSAEYQHQPSSCHICIKLGWLMLMGVVWSTQIWAYSGGTGEPNDPYQIATPEDLIGLGQEPNDYDRHFILTADIDLSGYTFDRAVIASSEYEFGEYFLRYKFGGRFDGQGYVIRHLRVEGEDYLGLFGCCGSEAVITDLGLEAVDVDGTGGWIGGLVGYNDSGTIMSSYSTGSVSGGWWYIGGLVGHNHRGNITSSYSTSSATGEYCVGGLVGCNESGTITLSYSSSLVSGESDCGSVGGLVGCNESGTIISSYSTGSTSGPEAYRVGGLVGENSFRGIVTSSYSTGSVCGQGYIGGLVGYNRGNITSSYSVGSVIGIRRIVGGLVGNNSGIITSSYSTALVSGKYVIGGLVGENDSGSIASSFWDMEASAQESSDGGTGLTTTEMHEIKTFLDARWDFIDEADNGTDDTWFMPIGNAPGLSGSQSRYNPVPDVAGLAIAQAEAVLEDQGFSVATITYQLSSVVPDGHILSQDPEADSEYMIGSSISLVVSVALNGMGTDSDPYQISNAIQLILLAERTDLYDECFILTADIDLSDYHFDRAVFAGDENDGRDSFEGTEFSGSFDGQGHIISNLDVQGGSFLGLFGRCSSDAVIANLGLEAVTINGDEGYTQGYAEEYIGGLVGYNASGAIKSCYSSGSINGQNFVGGLVGINDSGTIMSCSSTVLITGRDEYIGGLVGVNESGLITSSSSTGSVSGGYDYIGGLVGYNESGIVASSFSTGSVIGDSSVGGLVGVNELGGVTLCYSTGLVTGGGSVGGLVGVNYGSITSSYSASAVTGDRGGVSHYYSSIGGLVGINGFGYIMSSYSMGSVSGYDSVGGLVGVNDSSIMFSYSTGLVSGRGDVGGLVGDNALGCIRSSFWDIETSGQSTSAGEGKGLSTDEMLDIDTYLKADWDWAGETDHGTCDFWMIQEGCYPSLTGFSDGSPAEPNGSGTPDDPYLLSDANDLGIVWSRPGAHYRLEADVDLNGIAWNSAVVPMFGGYFDGDGHVISNLNIDGEAYLGLFGICTSHATISNLGLNIVDVNGASDYVGGLVGYNWLGTIVSCYSDGVIDGREEVGGLIGENYKGSVFSCYSCGLVSGVSKVGGFIGQNDAGYLMSSYSTGRVTGETYVGGFVGTNDGLIESSFWDIEASDRSESDGGSGLTTAEMQDINTFLDAGWDFVGETANGTEDTWTMPEADYPHLTWEF